MSTERIVLETGVLISRVLKPDSTAGRAASKALTDHTVLVSDELLAEFVAVLARPKFAALVAPNEVREILQALGGLAERVALTAHVAACRNPGDDHVLALAVSGAAKFIVTGDADLLVLDPFSGVRILTPRAYLDGV